MATKTINTEIKEIVDIGKSVSNSYESEKEYFLLKDLQENFFINDRYRIEKLLGVGGFGIVYKVYDEVLKSFMALKFLDPKITSIEHKFIRVKREISISQNIIDKNVVRIFSLDKYENIYFFVMEFIEGRTLKDIIKKDGKFTWDIFLPLFYKILRGIDVLHQNNIVHRDIKPANIMVLENKDIKILDLGLAKALDDEDKTSSMNEVVGSVQYMSPEQIEGEEVDFRSDIYQLGLVFYYSITGSLPFDIKTNTYEMLFKRISDRPITLKSKGIKTPKYIEFGIEKALEKEKNDRFDSVSALKDYLHKGLYPIFGRTINKVRKKPFYLFISFVLVLIVLGLYLKLSNKFTDIDQIDCNGNTVSVFSKVGTKLFSKEFKDNKVIYAVKHIMPKKGIGLNKSENFEEMVCVFLEPETKNNYDSFQSFKDNTNKKNIVLFNKEKENLAINKYFFIRQNSLSNLYYDFANTYIINKNLISRTDLDNDGYKDILFMQTHLYGMFPTANYFISKNNVFHLSNPGPYTIISKKKQKTTTDLLLYGYNNLISHLKFIAIKQFHTPITNSFYNNALDIEYIMKPSLNKISETNFNGEIFFISRTSNIISNNWFEKNGSIKFVDNQNKEELIQIFKDGRIIRKFDGKMIEFKDEKKSLDIVYDCIDKYYKEKMLSKNWDKALKYINKALDVNIKNPWLNSALLNYKGDLYAKKNDYQNAIDTLNKSIDIYRGNIDAYQKRCEIEFLKGDIDKSIRLVTGVDDNMSAFWGLLIVGRDLFKSYCYLQKGDFISIEDLIENIYSSATGKSIHKSVKSLLESTLVIFQGNYTKAVKTINGLRGKSPTPYTLIEFRLLFSRAVILDSIFNKKNTNQKLLDLAKFYIKDIAINSISSNHLAKVSRAYFFAIDGRKREAERMAKEGFEEVLQMSRGDFFTKFWLFYDAFIYGKTMEILGNKTEAIRGYKECIKANPYTDLAKRVKK